MCTDVLYHKSVCKYLVCDSQSLRRRLRVTRIALPAATTQLQLRRGGLSVDTVSATVVEHQTSTELIPVQGLHSAKQLQ